MTVRTLSHSLNVFWIPGDSANHHTLSSDDADVYDAVDFFEIFNDFIQYCLICLGDIDDSVGIVAAASVQDIFDVDEVFSQTGRNLADHIRDVLVDDRQTDW